VPDGTRDAASGELVHDDDLMTGAMCTLLGPDGVAYAVADGVDYAERSGYLIQ